MADDPEFAALFAREGERVLMFLARRTLDAAVAGDLMAETFAIALSSWARLQGRSEAELRAWLFTVARRQLSRYLRRARVERRAIERLGVRVPPMHEDDVARIEERAGLAQLRAALGLELERLSADQREALRLRVIEDRRTKRSRAPSASRSRRRAPACPGGCVRSPARLSPTGQEASFQHE